MASDESRSKWIQEVHAWEQRMTSAVAQYQVDFDHQKYTLQLQIETHPELTLLFDDPQLQFQPSPVLVQLLQNDKRRSIAAKSASHQKQKTKNAEYLERKLESEIRQHYELENAQSCAKWKRFHLQTSEPQKELAQRIESEFQQLCKRLNVCCTLPPVLAQEAQNQVITTAMPSSNQPQSSTLFSNQDEAEFRLQLTSDWIQQERFNIQEAFTNQTRKIQADFQGFLDQLDQQFESERARILSMSTESKSNTTFADQHVNIALPLGSQHKGVVIGQGNQQMDKQFKSNAERHMLVHTVPVVDPHSHSQVAQLLRTPNSHTNNHRKTDVSATQQQLDYLQARMKTLKENAETKRREGMEWIGRQCAHLFSQLDCKETEAKLVFLVQKQHQSDTRELLKRIAELAQTIRDTREQQ